MKTQFVISNEREISHWYNSFYSFYAIPLFDRNDDSFYGPSFFFCLIEDYGPLGMMEGMV